MKLDSHEHLHSSTFTDGSVDISSLSGFNPGLSVALRAILIALGAAALGVAMAVFWSYDLVDNVIGASIADTALGNEAKSVDIGLGGPLLGVFFAFVAGMAATFTACNCVVFSCVAPIVAHKSQQHVSIAATLGWLVAGVVSVTALYGASGAIFGQALPVLSTGTIAIGSGYPLRLAQSTVIFTILGAIFFWWGLALLGLVPSPLVGYTTTRQWLRPLALGLLIGFFTVGRPFGLFQKAFAYTATVGNPFLGALAISLQGLGNIIFVVMLTIVLLYGTGGRVERWMRQHPRTLQTIAAVSMITGGIFFITYWGVRVPSYFDITWFPHMPYR